VGALHQEELLADWKLCKSLQPLNPLNLWSNPMLHIIERVQADSANYTVAIAYRDQPLVLADFKPLIEQGGVMTALSNPATFAAVRIGPRGRSLVWGEDIEFCADGLWEKFGQMGRAAA
jgi:hypothetical protein